MSIIAQWYARPSAEKLDFMGTEELAAAGQRERFTTQSVRKIVTSYNTIPYSTHWDANYGLQFPKRRKNVCYLFNPFFCDVWGSLPGRAIKKRLGQKKRKSIENGKELLLVLLHPAKPDVKNIWHNFTHFISSRSYFFAAILQWYTVPYLQNQVLQSVLLRGRMVYSRVRITRFAKDGK